MRRLTKLPKPEILEKNESAWLKDFLADSQNNTKRYRYRDPQIKSTLRTETADKCAYCESKLGHSSPGDVEHKVPSSKVPERQFDWTNLTLACQECNRRKNDFYDDHDGFIDPYVDEVETLIEHCGPVVIWKTGELRAEVSVGILELSSVRRAKLIERKIERLSDLCHILERFEAAAPESAIKSLLKLQVCDMAGPKAEFSAMVRSALISKGYGEVFELV